MTPFEKETTSSVKSFHTVKKWIYNNCINIDAPFIGAFSRDHIMYLAAFGTILLSMILGRDFVATNSAFIARILLVISISQQILLYSWYYYETNFDLKEALPLHICRLSTIMGMFYFLTGNEMIMNVLFFFGIFAYFSFFMPSRINKPYHISGISYFINHTITILVPYFAYFATGWTPSWSGLWVAYACFIVYWLVAYVVNERTGGNYFYMRKRPLAALEKVSNKVYMSGNFVCTLILFLIGFGLFHLFI